MSAEVLGTRGSTPVDGATLRAKLGLFDTWAYFRTITGAKSGDASPDPQASDPSGGAPAPARLALAREHGAGALRGSVLPGRRGATARVQALPHGRWVDVSTTRLGRGGAYRWTAPAAGTYRVVFDGAPGPAVRVG
jgi:hypothetical protein